MNQVHLFNWGNRRWWTWMLLIVACCIVIPVSPVFAAEPNAVAQTAWPDFNHRQTALIKARIYSHSGDVAKAMAIYRHLMATNPSDREIHMEYCTFLLDQRQYALAQAQLTDLLTVDPTNQRAQHLQARLYSEQTQYGWSVYLYDRILQLDPGETTVWSDYAGARLASSQWAAALSNYSRVLEQDPDNRDVRQLVHELLKTHGPRLDINYRRYEQLADDTRIDTGSIGWSAPVSETTRLFADYRYIDLARPAQPFAGGVNGYLSDIMLKLDHQFNQRWSAVAGIGGYKGASRDTSFLVGASLTPVTGININADYQLDRPWYDPVDAVENGGAYDRLRLSVDWNDGRRTSVLVQGEDWRYHTDGASPYGRQQTILAMLSFRLLPAPELVAGYSYYRAGFDYETDDYRPVAMVEDQGWHSLFVSLVHRPWDYGSWGAYAGYRFDHVRNLSGWFIQPAFKLAMGNRLELDVSYDYASESTGTVDGETQTVQVAARLYF